MIVDGACRDVDEIAELGLPVYARSATPRTARGRLAEVGWGAPVRVADVTSARVITWWPTPAGS